MKKRRSLVKMTKLDTFESFFEIYAYSNIRQEEYV